MRLIIVSNRLPVHLSYTANRKPQIVPSVGGLTTGLASFLASAAKHKDRIDHLWVGWPGDLHGDPSSVIPYLAKRKLHSVILDERDAELFYNGFCNNTIWPLFHYFPSYASYNTEEWNSYRAVNEQFARELKAILRPDDTVWIHDYHLMLLPRMLRDEFPDLSIGFFLHIPFPVFEIFRILPRRWREQILRGMLGSDVVGFHTYAYTRYFLGCVTRILGLPHTVGKIETENRIIKVDTFPMGVDFEKFHNASSLPSVQKHMTYLRKSLEGARLILSVDRLDYTKGIFKRLEAFELFLEEHPEFHDKVTLILIVVPSRTSVEQYQQMKQEIDRLVGKINGEFASVTWTPIIYQYKSLPFEKLSALYHVSDIALITPLRDGMNLVAKEYVLSRKKSDGVLILSEMAGAADELGAALCVNPHHINEIADAIVQALTMPHEEQQRRMQAMQERLQKYPVERWVRDFLDTLSFMKQLQRDEKRCEPLTILQRAKIKRSFLSAKRRLILLDYDGTLVPFTNAPDQAVPDKKLLSLLKRLGSIQHTDVVIASGRDRKTLDEWFRGIPVYLSAEHGVWISDPKDKEWHTIQPLQNEWKTSLRPILENYTSRLPGSFIEEKEYSLAWHYRLSAPSLARARAKELSHTLTHLTASENVQVLKGNQVMELRCAGVDKGQVALHYLEHAEYNFVLAVGDDTTDEDLFHILPKNAYSLKVGATQNSAAHYFVESYADARHFLDELVSAAGVHYRKPRI